MLLGRQGSDPPRMKADAAQGAQPPAPEISSQACKMASQGPWRRGFPRPGSQAPCSLEPLCCFLPELPWTRSPGEACLGGADNTGALSEPQGRHAHSNPGPCWREPQSRST